MIRQQQWCIEKIPGEKSWRYLRINGPQGGMRSFAKVAASDDIRATCQGHIHLCYSPIEYYLYNDQFAPAKQDLLDMQISKRFGDRGLTMDVGNFVHRAGKIEGKPGWLNCLFAPEAELAELYSFIRPWKKINSCRIVPAAAAVAALIQALTDDAVLVFLLGDSESQVIVVKGGTPLYNQSLTLAKPGMIDEALIPHAIDFARAIVKKDHNIDTFHIISMGQARASIDLQSLDIQEWQPDFSRVLNLKSPEEVLLYPQLFGAGYVKKNYDFLPKEYANSWRLQSFSKRTSIAAAAAGIALLGGWLYLQPSLKEQRVHYQELSASITQEQQALSNRLPTSSTLDTFDRLKTIRTLVAEDFRLDNLAGKLSLALPENVHITSLKVRRQAVENGSAAEVPAPAPGAAMAEKALSIPEQLQSQNVLISVSCTTAGNYAEVTARFENIIIALNSIFKVTDMTWNYKEASRTGQLNCELLPMQEVVKL